MPLQCPACSTEIQKAAAELLPIPGAVYRCAVCRLELVLNRYGDEMIIAPDGRDTVADWPLKIRNRSD